METLWIAAVTVLAAVSGYGAVRLLESFSKDFRRTRKYRENYGKKRYNDNKRKVLRGSRRYAQKNRR